MSEPTHREGPTLEWLEYMAANETGTDTIRRSRESGTVVVFDVKVDKRTEVAPADVGQGSPP